MKKCVALSIFIYFLPVFLFSVDKIEVELIDQFYLDQSKEFLGRPKDIAIDNEENIFVTDSATSNIKIYNSSGLLIKTFGRKGGGPGEFLKPWTIDYHKGRFCVQDVGLFKYLIFNKDFEEITRFFYLVDGDDFVLQDNRIISNDYFKDKNGNDFRGIIMNFCGKVMKVLMPIKFGINDAWNRITNSKAFVDVSNREEIYFVKERDVKFFKFDKKGNFLNNFGKNPSYFISCRKTKDFEHTFFTNDPNRRYSWERWRRSSTWVSGIFVLEDFLGIAIRKYNNKINKWECFLLFYDLDSNLLNEGIKIIEAGTSSDEGFFIYSNHKDRIYILEIFEGEQPRYKFYKYKVKRK